MILLFFTAMFGTIATLAYFYKTHSTDPFGKNNLLREATIGICGILFLLFCLVCCVVSQPEPWEKETAIASVADVPGEPFTLLLTVGDVGLYYVAFAVDTGALVRIQAPYSADGSKGIRVIKDDSKPPAFIKRNECRRFDSLFWKCEIAREIRTPENVVIKTSIR